MAPGPTRTLGGNLLVVALVKLLVLVRDDRCRRLRLQRRGKPSRKVLLRFRDGLALRQLRERGDDLAGRASLGRGLRDERLRDALQEHVRRALLHVEIDGLSDLRCMVHVRRAIRAGLVRKLNGVDRHSDALSKQSEQVVELRVKTPIE